MEELIPVSMIELTKPAIELACARAQEAVIECMPHTPKIPA
jgi:hypothetical protein